MAVEGVSLDGSAELLRREFPAERRAALEADLAAAEAEHAAAPTGIDAIVWHARRLGYLDRYSEAIAVLTAGLETLKRLKEPGTYQQLEEKSKKLVEGLLSLGRAAGHTMCGGYAGGMFGFLSSQKLDELETAGEKS